MRTRKAAEGFGSAARRWLGVALVAAALLTTAGCDRIDKSQWRDFPSSTRGATSTSTRTNSGSTSSGGGTSRSTVTVTRTATATSGAPAASDTSGLVPGGTAGARRSQTATAVVTTAAGTCWVLVVDANTHRGCGNAAITDTYGEAAARITKASGPAVVSLALLRNGSTISSGQVSGVDRYVTVRG